MKNFTKTIVATAWVMVVWPGSAVLAGDTPAPEARQFSDEVGAVVNMAMEDLSAAQYRRTIDTLRNVQVAHKLTPYESATVYQMLGSALYQTNDFEGAIQAFESALTSGGLLPKEAVNLRINIAQLLIASHQYAKGAQMLEDWQADGGTLKPAHIEMLWQAWSQAEKFDRALPWAEKWFEAANPKQRKHYDLLNFLYLNLQMPEKRLSILEQMLEKWPDNQEIIEARAVLKQ